MMSASNVAKNDVVKFGMTALTTAPFGTMSLSVTGPTPDSRFPTPLLAPSPTTAPILAHVLSSALSVPAVTRELLRNSLLSGEVNFIKAPGLANLKFDVAKSPMDSAPPDVKY